MKQLLLTCGWLLTAASAGYSASLSTPVTFSGMCDASAAVSLGPDLFVVANDEDNVLRVYRRSTGGAPIFTHDLRDFLVEHREKKAKKLGKSGKPKNDKPGKAPKGPEADIEGSARIGDLIFWITSHGRNASGEEVTNRHRFFATTVTMTNGQFRVTPVGVPYGELLRDLENDPRLAKFDLAKASLLAPKAPDGLNIEGLTSTPEGHLLIAFRNPIPGGRALMVPLLNPAELIEDKPARFGPPVLLDLGGLGVRSLGRIGSRYYVIAGSHDGDGESRIYEWAGGQAVPQLVEGVEFAGSNPEGLSVPGEDGREDFFIVSDDGTVKVEGMRCKDVPDPAKRYFRGFTLRP